MSPQKLFIRLVSLCALATALNASAQSVTVVEYYNKTLDAHFITGRANEQTALDGVADFRRTGMTFAATAVASAPASLTKICRFYISIASPYVSSHFYGRQGIDCESIRAQNVAGFSWEDYDFATQQPTAGACPAGTTPIFRGFRAAAAGKTSNHRYSASQATYDAAALAGYVGEGAAFCATAATAATPTTGAVATAVGTPNGTPVSASIGPAGGTLTSADGKLTLTVPVNAVASSVAFTIQPVSNEAPGGTGNAYSLLPDGQTFAVPVKIAFRYDDLDVAGTVPEAFDVAYQNAQRFWRVFKVVQLDKTNRVLTISTSHFTSFAKRSKVKLITPAPRLRVGDAERLTLNICEGTDVGGDVFTLPAKGCANDGGFDVVASGWAVNGIAGGNSATVGAVSQTGPYAAVYAAPAKKPTPDVVAVSVELGLGTGKYLVVMQITIVDDSWVGTTTATIAGAVSAVTAVTWTLDTTLSSVAYYRPSGVTTLVGGQFFGCTTTPPSAPVSPAGGIFTIDSSTNPPIYDGTAVAQWSATFTCPGDPPIVSGGLAGVIYFDATGAVSADGKTIEGSGVSRDQTGWNITWKFTR